MAPELLGVDVELDDRGARTRQLPVERRLAAHRAAREEDEVGLEHDPVDATLASEAYLDRVEASTRQAAALGVTGIPAWLLDRRLLVLGAQPRAVFEEALASLAAGVSPSDT
jgi:hypothetical protein